MTTLAEAILAAAPHLGSVYRSAAQTGSSATQIVDANLLAPAGLLTNGTVWILSGTYAGKSGPVLGHSGDTITFPTFGGAIVAGVAYAVTPTARRVLVQGVNDAAQELGELTYIDNTLDTEAGVQEYELPDGVRNVVAVKLDDAHWVTRFDVLQTGYLRFDETPAAAYSIGIYYNKLHPQLALDADELVPGVNLERLGWEAAECAYRVWLREKGMPADDDPGVTLMNEAKDKAAKAGRHYTFRLPAPLALRGW